MKSNVFASSQNRTPIQKINAPIHTAVVTNVSEKPMAFTNTHETVKDEKKQRRRRSIIQEFSLNTSTHGLPGIARSESVHNRVFWTISFVCFTGVMVYFVTTAMITYFNYPTQFDFDVIREWPQYFPAVSICNAAPFRVDRLTEPFLNFTRSKNITTPSNASTIPPYLLPWVSDFMIDQCSYNSIPCSAADFIQFTSSTYGLCYTFNAKMKDSSAQQVRYGNAYGGDGVLDLELYVHSHDSVPYFYKGIGIVALVHDNAELPLIEASGILLKPGKDINWVLKKKTTFLLSAPYTSCTDHVSQSMEIMFDKYYSKADYGYSRTACYLLCEQGYSYERCGCVNPHLWNARYIILPQTKKIILAPVCQNVYANSCYTQAVDELLNSPSLIEKYCSDCSQQCSLTDFVIQKSALATPLGWQMPLIKSFVENSGIPLPTDWSNASSEYIRKDYLSLIVARETTIVENSTQRAQLGVVDVLSNIGGQTGLWIGISFLSIMEFIEMLYRLTRRQCHAIRLRCPRRNRIIA